MTTNQTVRQDALPDEMRILLRDYPREAWPGHPNFAASIQNWMGAHDMFRQLGREVRLNTQSYLNKDRSAEDSAGRLAYYGNLLVRNLHGHHGWEDHSFFPELSAADGRFDAGLETLETDHLALDNVLDRFTRQANRVVKLTQLDEAQAYEESGALLETASEIEAFLARHLVDEEDLVVPILLHHKLRG
ncbi:hemerythrin HHE cation binding domain-containing protein [Litoreibacter halocynthiae]|uniref:Hemerythrin HHE cation binding domain-containing protein n=1 Tax=Litoreibacter halocynthiae TaxID=1242689 RepID=A0A4R7LQ68_9RHOB|nr:hemerythrin HHE cation binding domain-containing protein [Litoreibacter halocynthiae]